MVFRFADLDQDILCSAAACKWDDFEDAVQYVTAIRIKADCIVTRNVKDYHDCSIPVITPAELMQTFRENWINDEETGLQ